ncbi:MAG: L-lysine exporter [Microbacterium sp.]
MLSSVLAGLGLGFSLIVAIGAQNLFVLRQGLRREHVFAVAAICAISDAALIAVGVSGVGFVLESIPWLVDVVRWAGAAFLITYGVLAARRAWRPSDRALAASDPEPTAGPSGSPAAVLTQTSSRLAPVILTCLALTWLNPHVYLDTVFLLGTVANTHDEYRWLFAAGAMAASIVWFFGLAFGARYLGRWLSTPKAWRILDAVIAVVMVALGVSLVLPH